MDSALETPFVPEEPSPWWLKGLAIFMALISIFMLLTVASAVATPMLLDRVMPDDSSEWVGDYPEMEPMRRRPSGPRTNNSSMTC